MTDVFSYAAFQCICKPCTDSVAAAAFGVRRSPSSLRVGSRNITNPLCCGAPSKKLYVLIPEPTASTETDNRREKEGLYCHPIELDAWTDLTNTEIFRAHTSILPVRRMDGRGYSYTHGMPWCKRQAPAPCQAMHAKSPCLVHLDRQGQTHRSKFCRALLRQFHVAIVDLCVCACVCVYIYIYMHPCYSKLVLHKFFHGPKFSTYKF
jgi:hypothetical protein